MHVHVVYIDSFLELWNVETRKAPQDKLHCIAKSCKLLLGKDTLNRGGRGREGEREGERERERERDCYSNVCLKVTNCCGHFW